MLNQDFRDMLSCLKGAEVEFIIVGAYALSAHGFPRATGDINIWVRNSPDNAGKIMTALAEFRAPLAGLSEGDFTTGDTVVQIDVQPCRIDITTGIDGIEFSEAWENKVAITVDGLDVYIPSKADLLKNKIASGRDKDQGDIVWLKKSLNHDA
jgi:hypothetical protein